MRLFRRDKVPARNTHRSSGFAFTHRKKFLRVPRGVFSKTLLGRVWDRVPQKERASQPNGVRLFRRDEVLSRNTHRPSGLAFTLRKKFLGVPRGVFSKTLLGREWDGVPQKERASQLNGVRLFRRDEVLSRNTHRPSGFAFTNLKKFLRVPRGVFSKTLLGREWDSVPQREGKPI